MAFTKTAGVVYGTPAVVLSTTAASGSQQAIRVDSQLIAFSTDVPEDIAYGQTAGTGTDAVAARLDHDHGMAALITAASVVEMEAASSTTVYASPGRTQNHPGVAKVWCANSADGETVLASYNLNGLTDGGAGNRTYVFETDFSSVNYVAVGSAGYPAGSDLQAPIFGQNTRLAGSIDCLMRSSGGGNVDVINFVAFFGGQ